MYPCIVSYVLFVCTFYVIQNYSLVSLTLSPFYFLVIKLKPVHKILVVSEHFLFAYNFMQPNARDDLRFNFFSLTNKNYLHTNQCIYLSMQCKNHFDANALCHG
jgi:hypothetical protein